LLIYIRGQVSLLSEARPAPAVVTHYTDAPHGTKVPHYEFPLLYGSFAKGQAAASNKPPKIGTTLCVVYDRENPRRNRPYPMALVKPAR
jgi:hypothetical protein